MAKSFLIDLTRCTACRGCQIACKQWHKLPAVKTFQEGTHQNPPDLSFHTYKLVRFTELMDGDKLKNWLFMPDQCRHCIDPPCKAMADGDDERAIYIDSLTGAVIYTDYTKNIEATDPMDLCPYNIPRRDPDSGIWSKCDMCLDRVHNGLLPACVKSCPTGAMSFGDREDMMDLAEKRLAAAKKQFPEASLADADQVRTIFLCAYSPESYYTYMTAEATGLPPLFTRQQMLARLARPFRQG